jgi:hypothetical protein
VALRPVERALALAPIEAAEWPLPIDAHTTPCLSMSAPRMPKYGFGTL